MKPEDTKVILGELEQGVGFVECNTLVIGLLREALVAQARAALARLPAAERGTSTLLNQVAEQLRRPPFGRRQPRQRRLRLSNQRLAQQADDQRVARDEG